MDIIILAIIGLSGFIISIMVYKSLPYIKFAYPTAKVEAIGNPFISEKTLSQILDAKSLNSFKNLVNSYKDFNVDGNNAEEIQKSLDMNMIESVKTLRKESPKQLEDFFDRFLDFLDGYNLKNFLKAKIKGIDIEVTPFSREVRKIIDSIETADIQDIQNLLSGYGISISQDSSPLEIDVEIDRYLLNRLSETKVPKVARRAKEEFVERLIDIANIRNLVRSKLSDLSADRYDVLFLGEGREIAEWRFRDSFTSKSLDEVISSLEGTSYYDIIRQAYEESKKQENFQILDLSLDKILLKSAEEISIKNFPFFGPLLKFIMARYFEIRNLKVIAKGIEENIPKDRIKKLLLIGG